MLASQVPAPLFQPWAASGAKTSPIPVTATSASLAAGDASLDVGFPPVTAQDPTAGGIAPSVQDENGGLFLATQARWLQSAGSPATYYSAGWSTFNNGYPVGAVLGVVGLLGAYWLNLVDNNTSNPDSSGTNWALIKPLSWSAIQVGIGTANAVALTLSPAPLTLASLAGSVIKFTVPTACTGSVSVTINGFTTIPLLRSDANAVQSGDTATGVIYEGIVTAGAGSLQLISSVMSQISSTSPLNLATDTSGTPNLIVASPSPSISYIDGTRIVINPANSCTGPTTANISGGGVVNVTRPDGTNVGPNDIIGQQRFEIVVKVAAGPVTTLQMIAWPQNAVGAANSITGSAHTYVVADAGKQSRRSNSGSAMVDLLPGATAGALPAGWSGTVANTDATALLAVQVGVGSTLTGPGVSNGTIVLGPGQQATFVSTGTNYTCYGSPARAVLRANTTLFFLLSGGSDTANAGITSGSAFQSGTHAYDWAQQFLDLAGFQLTISAPGTNAFTAGISCVGPLLGQASPVIFQGAGSGSTSITTTTAPCFSATNCADIQYAAVTLASTSGNLLFSTGSGSMITQGTGVVHGATSGYQSLTNNGSQHYFTASYSISGGSTLGHWENFGGQTFVTNGITITFTTASLFFGAFASADFSGSILSAAGVTFAGSFASVTGVRYAAQTLACIITGTGVPNYFPGSSPGSTPNGGQYI